ncbi:hypothetical protein I317_06963 [Kwoniella heveanensis CBS 569]|nr:hypothetical protein I317_06963 [Kwoniella heveanensis CBS 569]
MPPAQDCQEEACAIQSCLTRNNYNDAKCQTYVFNLYKCCSEMYKNQIDKSDKGSHSGSGSGSGGSESSACPIQSVVERKMKRFESEGKV